MKNLANSPKLGLPSPGGTAASRKTTAATARKKPRAVRKVATKAQGGGDSHKENEMRKTRKKVNEKIGQIVADSSNEDAGQLFRALSKVGGNNFRRAMRRVHRIIKKQAKRGK